MNFDEPTIIEKPLRVKKTIDWILISAGGSSPGDWIDQGSWDASGNLFPSTNVKKGYTWDITVSGTLGGESIDPGAIIRAKVDNPGQTLANWWIHF